MNSPRILLKSVMTKRYELYVICRFCPRGNINKLRFNDMLERQTGRVIYAQKGTIAGSDKFSNGSDD
jgi:hypothetical protein